MRRKYTPWILALSLTASMSIAAVGEEFSVDIADASVYTSSDDEGENTGGDTGGENVGNNGGDNTGQSETTQSETTQTETTQTETTQTETTAPQTETTQTETTQTETTQTETTAPQTETTQTETTQTETTQTETTQTETTAPQTETTQTETTAPTETTATETAASETKQTETETSTSKETETETAENETLPEETLLEDEEFDPDKEADGEDDESSIQVASTSTVQEHEETETDTEKVRGGANVSDGGAGELYIAVHGYPVGDLTKNEKKIYRYLREELGLNKAAACGVLSNIYFESNFSSIAIGDGGTSLGLCQWHLGRCRSLMSWCESKDLDYRSVEGQLEYLKYELENAYSGVLGYLYGVPDTAKGAYRAGHYFCMYFESPSDVRVRSDARGTYAKVSYYPSDLDKYLEEEDEEDFEGKDGQIDRVLSAEVTLIDTALLEEVQDVAEDSEDIEVQDVVLEEYVDEDAKEKEEEKKLVKEKAASTVTGSKLTVGEDGKTVSVTKDETEAAGSAPEIVSAAPAPSAVVLIPSDASKPGTQNATAEKTGFDPSALAK